MLRTGGLVLLVVCAGHLAHAQEAAQKTQKRISPPLGCDRLSIGDGLPNSDVKAIAQDRNGFMWFGTADGLARYDGIHMRVYRPSEDASTLASGYVTALELDPSGKLWVGASEGGINLYDPSTDKFTRFTADAKRPDSPSSEGVTAIARDPKDRIWFAMSGGGLDRYDAAKGGFVRFVSEPLDVAITALHADSTGTLWLGTSNEGVLRWNPDDGTTTRYKSEDNDEVGLGAAPITAILPSSSGTIWIGTDGEGLFSLEPKTGKVVAHRHVENDPTTISDDHISSMFEDKQKRVWIGTANGLDRIDAAEGFVAYQHDPNDPTNPAQLAFPSVETVFQDAGGVMWVGGFTVGVCKFFDLREKFGHYRTQTYGMAFSEDPDGTLWVGTYNGLYKYEWPKKTVTIYHTLGTPRDPEPQLGLESVWINALHRDGKGWLWMALQRHGLVAFNPKTEQYRHYVPTPDNPNSLPVDTVFDIYEDDTGMLWLATFGGGLVRFDPKDEHFTAFTSHPGDALGLTSNHLYKLYPDPTDPKILWIGSAKGGLMRFDTVSATVQSFRHNKDKPDSLSSDDVLSIYRDRSGILWLGTFGGGLNRLDPKTGQVQRFLANNSKLSDNTVQGILPDDDGRLWLSTNGGGLVEFDPKTQTFLAFDTADGVQDSEFSQGSYMRSKSGKLFFGGAGGFNAFNPHDITRDTYVPPVVMTAFKVFNQDVTLDRPIWTLPPLQVSYSDSFEVQFAALGFASPHKNRYAYKLDGFDDKFIETDRPYATYTKLHGGHYTLRVRASNEHGVWNETGLSFALAVTPPIWQTWPAYALYVLLFASATFWLIRAQRRRVQRAEREGRLAVVERDLALTGAVQTGFLPENDEIQFGHLHIFGMYRPADACSGDWWWHERLAGGRHLIVVGDVTGHGPGPAMVTAAVATAFHVLVEDGLTDVEAALERLNREVLRVAKGRYHMTMAVLEVDEASGHWVFYSAGSPPLLTLSQNGKHRVHFCPGAPLGAESGFEAGRLDGQLDSFERMLLYTDGIPEITLPNGKLLGLRRFAQHVEMTHGRTLRDAASSIVLAADQARGSLPQDDDWTLAMIQWS